MYTSIVVVVANALTVAATFFMYKNAVKTIRNSIFEMNKIRELEIESKEIKKDPYRKYKTVDGLYCVKGRR